MMVAVVRPATGSPAGIQFNIEFNFEEAFENSATL